MSGFLIRLRLFIKLYFTSIYTMIMILSIPVVAIVIYNSGTYETEKLASITYEKLAPIWLVFISQWCLSIEFDSKFIRQLVTYPIAKWKFLLERFIYSSLIYYGLLIVVTMCLTLFIGSFFWKSLVFSIPVYIGMSGFVLAGTIIANHSLGGLLASIFFWMVTLFGGIFLKDLHAILLVYQDVQRFVTGESGFLSPNNHWILYNRFLYLGIGVLFMIVAMLKFNRKSI